MTNTSLVVYLVSISFAAYLTGVFGMNLDQTVTVQPLYGVFEAMFVGSFSMIFIVSSSIMYYLKGQHILPKKLEYYEKGRKFD